MWVAKISIKFKYSKSTNIQVSKPTSLEKRLEAHYGTSACDDHLRFRQHLPARLGGHSTTTWTKVYPILTIYPSQVDNCGYFT